MATLLRFQELCVATFKGSTTNFSINKIVNFLIIAGLCVLRAASSYQQAHSGPLHGKSRAVHEKKKARHDRSAADEAAGQRGTCSQDRRAGETHQSALGGGGGGDLRKSNSSEAVISCLSFQEMSAREEAEARQREAEKRIAQMQADMERARLELAEAHNTIHSLEEQLKQLQKAKQLLEQKEYELRELTAQLQSEKAMSDDERRRLRDQVDAREREVYNMRVEVERQTTVTRQLQTQVSYQVMRFEKITIEKKRLETRLMLYEIGLFQNFKLYFCSEKFRNLVFQTQFPFVPDADYPTRESLVQPRLQWTST